MKKNNYKHIFLVSVLVVVLPVFLFLVLYIYNDSTNNIDIDKILKTESYEYLPNEANQYIKLVYKETGVILLTEKNKEENVPYLNPEFIEYLSTAGEYLNNEEFNEDNSYEVIPSETLIDYIATSSLTDEDELPSSFDLRNVEGKNFVTPVKDQDSTGLCWSFARAFHFCPHG